MRWLRWLIGWTLVVAIVSGVGWLGYAYYQSAGEETELRFEKVIRGDLTVAVEATGTLQPEETIDVGAQVAGMVREFGRDPDDSRKEVSYGSRVQKGTVLARLDDRLFRTRLASVEASLDKLNADLGVLRAKLNQAERDWGRNQEGRLSRVITEQEYDAARALFEVSSADYQRGLAALKEAEALRNEAKINLDYTVITSPVDGVVIDRRVNVGQTVVASLNAPSLFLIAADLTRMQIWVQVNEADIGQIRVGQPVQFTVDAHPDETFHGTVSQIRNNASMLQNVVTYPVIVDTANPDLKLRPYLSANVRFLVNQRHGSLLVPNTALRYKPTPDQIDPAYRTSEEPAPAAKPKGPPAGGKGPAGKGGGPDGPPRERKPPVTTGTVWVMDADGMRPVKLRVGVSDGKRTEVLAILDGTLDETTEVVVGEVQVKKEMTVNPFAPPPWRSSKSKKK